MISPPGKACVKFLISCKKLSEKKQEKLAQRFVFEREKKFFENPNVRMRKIDGQLITGSHHQSLN